VADSPPLLFRVGDASQPLQEFGAGIHHSEIDAEVSAEGLFHLIAFVQAEQPVIHEDAGEPVADGAVHQDGRNRGIHAA
jgi:hypothetical protein